MRNLKRALSLTLASVMLLGMMVVGSSAASYPDVDDNDNVEAIEVLQAVQVMRGDDKGNFNPDSPVTRSEMAVIMALLLDLDYQYYEATCPFNDVPSWARPYVGACYANKIVSGYDANTYGSNDGVTPVQAASMMMRALGYFKYDVDYSDGFETATVRQGTSIGIFDGVGSSANVAMTRNQVARMALNALQCGMVEPDGNSLSITTPDGFTVAQGRTNYVYVIGRDNRVATAINDKTASSGTGNSGLNGYILDLGEQLYNGDLRKTSVNDGFGAPATRWAYKNAEVGTYADEADYTLEGTVKSSAMYSTVGKAVAEDYRWVVKMDGQTTNLNDATKPLFGKDEVKKNNSDDLAGTGRGTTTYIYLDNTAGGTGNNAYAGTATVCVLNTYAAEVTKVADGKITLDDQDGKRLDFKTAGYAEDDVVLYNKYKDGSDWVVGRVIGEAERVEGEANSVRDGKYVVIGETTYNYSAKFDDDFIPVSSAGAEVAIYLDRQGNIIYLGEVAENQDYALVLSVGWASNKYDASVSEFGAKLMLSDGTTLNVDLDKDFTDPIAYPSQKARAAEEEETPLDRVWNALVGRAVAYTKESGGTYKLETEGRNGSQYLVNGIYGTGDIIENGRSSIIVGVDDAGKNIYAYTNSNTVFVLNDKTDSDTTYTAYTGYENVPDVGVLSKDDGGTLVSAYVDSKGIVKVVFVTDGDIKGTDDVVFVVGDPGAKENRDKNGDRYYVYKAIVDGEATEIKVKKNSSADDAVKDLEKDVIGVYSRITKDSDGYVTKLVLGTNIDVSRYNGTQRLNGSVYGFGYNTENKSYSYHIGPSSDTVIGYLDGSALTVEGNLQNDPNDPAIVVTKEGKLLGVFVKKLADDAVDPNAPVTITVEKGEGVKTVTLSGTTIKKGETVTVTVELETGYKDAKVEVTNATYADGKITNPTGAVTVKVSATKDEDSKIELNVKLHADDVTAGVEIAESHIITASDDVSSGKYASMNVGDLYIAVSKGSNVTLISDGAVQLSGEKNGMSVTTRASSNWKNSTQVAKFTANEIAVLDLKSELTLTKLTYAVAHEVVVKSDVSGLKFTSSTPTLAEGGGALALNITDGLPKHATEVKVTLNVAGVTADSTLSGTASGSDLVFTATANNGALAAAIDIATRTNAKADPKATNVVITVKKVEVSKLKAEVKGATATADDLVITCDGTTQWSLPTLTISPKPNSDVVSKMTAKVTLDGVTPVTAGDLSIDYADTDVAVASGEITVGTHKYTCDGTKPVTITVTTEVTELKATAFVLAGSAVKSVTAGGTAAVKDGANDADITLTATVLDANSKFTTGSVIEITVVSGAKAANSFKSAATAANATTATITIPKGALTGINGEEIIVTVSVVAPTAP